MEKMKELIPYIVILILVILLKLFIVTPIRVNGTSMMNTLHPKDIMILNKTAYLTKNPKRFDIVVVRLEDEDIIKRINGLEECSKDNKGITFIIALNYGSRDEITRATKKMALDVKAGKLNPEEITEKTIESYLDTAGIPDPDLLIRTSGEIRLSNYLLWQLAYTEFYFTDVLWPDFNKEELKKAIVKYNQRDRRFGGIK